MKKIQKTNRVFLIVWIVSLVLQLIALILQFTPVNEIGEIVMFIALIVELVGIIGFFVTQGKLNNKFQTQTEAKTVKEPEENIKKETK